MRVVNLRIGLVLGTDGGFITRLLTPFAGHLPFAIFCDSLEVYDSDWSPDLALEFATRRGYDVAPLLPVLAADRGMEGAMVREDWGRTLTELLDERFITPLATWARERGTRLRIQGYGIPQATVSSNAVAASSPILVDAPISDSGRARK